MKKDKPDKKQDISADKLRKSAACCVMSASQNAANAIKAMTNDVVLDKDGTTGADFNTMVNILESKNRAVSEGDLRSIEAMLLDQSHVLQSVFMIYTQKMSNSKYTENVEAYARIALRAQNQCRQTLATLVELKNPKRATFIKQQNNAVNQQINQSQQSEILKNRQSKANELFEEIPHEQLDTGTPQASFRADQALETLGEVDGTEDT